MSKKEQREKKPKRLRRAVGASFSNLFKSIFLILLLAGIAGLTIGSFVMLSVIAEAPSLDVSRIYATNSTLIFDMEGELIDERGTERREWVDFQDISPTMIDAILSTEDANFFTHNGVDWRRTLIANIQNLGTWFGESYGIQGGSTITQQLIKMSHLTDDRDGWEGIVRKVQEIYLSMQIEQALTKEQILAAYLNFAPFGGSLNGVQRAAEFYFGTDAANLTLSEAAALAGMVQAPNTWRPDHSADNTERRRDIVLELMVRHGYITEEMATLAAADPITDNLVYSELDIDNRNKYQPFVDAVLDEIRDRFGIDAHSGLRVFTTMNRPAQAFLYDLQNTNTFIQWPSDEFQTAIAFLETQTGIVRAIGRGRDGATGERNRNRATQNPRQPGSTAKSIFAYAPGMEFLGWGTGTSFNDELYGWENGQRIRNWNNQYHGRLTIRQALDMSWNVPAAKATMRVMDTIGTDGMTEWLEGLGIGMEGFTDGIPNPAAALGGAGHGWTPLQMAAAYAAFGNGGIYNEPTFIDRIILPDGTVLYSDDHRISQRAMSEETAWMTTETLRSVMTRGTGATHANVGVGHMNLAGKTGTTQLDPAAYAYHNLTPGVSIGMNDSWFIGYSGGFTAAVWTGHDDWRDGYITNAQQGISGRIFNQVMRNLNTENSQLPRPQAVQQFTIELESGTDGNVLLASTNTPAAYQSPEWFRVGTQPTTASTRFTQLDTPQNFRASQSGTEMVFRWDHIAGATMMDRSSLVSALNHARAVGRTVTNVRNAPVLNPTEADAVMMLNQLDRIGATIYTVSARTSDGSTIEIGNTYSDTLTTTVSLGELARITEFFVVARYENWAGLASNPSAPYRVNFDPGLFEVSIPNMRGWLPSEATSWADDNGVYLHFVQENHDEVAEGRIIGTDPSNTTTIGATIRVNISSGPSQSLPDPDPDPITPPPGQQPDPGPDPDLGTEPDSDPDDNLDRDEIDPASSTRSLLNLSIIRQMLDWLN